MNLERERLCAFCTGVKLTHEAHLAYCTNVHRGSNWTETLQSLEIHTLAVREKIAPGRPFAIGLRLSNQASQDLSDPAVLRKFQDWLKRHDCYVFTINGFPYGAFHGTRVKEQVSQPDWTSPERLRYTCRLFDLLSQLVPPGLEGSVSTVPLSFKQFVNDSATAATARENLWRCIEHCHALTLKTGVPLHLGLEPEPFGTIENTDEFLRLMNQVAGDRPGDVRWRDHLGINYDTCHFALQYEDPHTSLSQITAAGIKVSKIHLSNALQVHPTDAILADLENFVDGVYFHQVIERNSDPVLVRYRDLDEALAAAKTGFVDPRAEWRIHFHVPLNTPVQSKWGTTSDHLLQTLEFLGSHPRVCQHLEMETYTWEVLPAGWKHVSVEEMLAGEYRWTLAALKARGFNPVV